ncbi:MAG: hypothetical protein ACE5K9_05380 [Candidatus Methylomirabilales bacterium]
MAEEKSQTPQMPFLEMMALWQKMMWESFETMMKGPGFVPGLGKAFETSSAFQEQIQKNIQVGLKAMNLPTSEDLRRINEGLSTMQAQLEAMKIYLETVETTMKLQEEWRKSVDQTMQRLGSFQEEGQKAFEAWTKQVQDFWRLWDDTTKRAGGGR